MPTNYVISIVHFTCGHAQSVTADETSTPVVGAQWFCLRCDADRFVTGVSGHGSDNTIVIDTDTDDVRVAEDPRSSRQRLVDADLLPNPESVAKRNWYVAEANPESPLLTDLWNMLRRADAAVLSYQRRIREYDEAADKRPEQMRRMENLLRWLREHKLSVLHELPGETIDELFDYALGDG